MALKINQHLNLVLPLEVDGTPEAEVPVQENGQTVLKKVRQPFYVHSSPLPREVFERYWLVFSQTFAKIYNEGLHMTAGPRIAAMAMRDIARGHGMLDGPEGVEHGVLDEMRRTSYVMMPTQKGWEQVMLQDAVAANLISADDYSEVENILAFFIVISAMHRSQERGPILEGAARLWGAQIISSNCSAFAASLPKLIVTANSGVKLGALSAIS